MSPLWWLCELSNFDKHRTLHVAGLLAKSLTITERNFAPGISYDIFGSTRPFIRDTPFVVMLRFLGTEWPFTVPVEQVKMDGPLEVDIVFDDGVPKVAVGAPLVATLNSIGGRVYDAIEGVSGEFLGTKLSEP